MNQKISAIGGALLLSACVCLTSCKDASMAANLGGSNKHAAIEVGEANFEEIVLNSRQPVLVDFWATWCGPCVALTPTVEKIAVDYQGRAKVVKINVDDAPAIARKYDITGIPALLYFKDGEEVDRLVGPETSDEITTKLDALF
jgi:thioredoxin 1